MKQVRMGLWMSSLALFPSLYLYAYIVLHVKLYTHAYLHHTYIFIRFLTRLFVSRNGFYV